MVSMRRVSKGLVASRPYYETLSPQATQLVAHQYATYMRAGKFTYRTWKQVRAGVPLADAMGDAAAGILVKRYVTGRPRGVVNRMHQVAQEAPKKDWGRKNGLGGRSWITEPGRYPMTIVFHDANRAGPHIDVHIGRFSVVYSLRNKDIYERLRYNRDGMLTEASRKLILDHVRGEIENGSRVPQNLDHTRTNAPASWVGGDPEARHYGAGRTRQVVLQSHAHVYKAHFSRKGTSRAPVEMYVPSLNPHRPLYLHQLYGGDDKRAPILVWGAKRSGPPGLEERLHLKLVHPEDLEGAPHQDRIDHSATTAKYDGSSAYVVITPKGTTVWSPRTAKSTGEQIEYTHKLGGFARTTAPETIVAMGEVMFRERTRWPWQRGGYVPQTVAAGYLNSHDVVPDTVVPEIRLYRVDRIGRSKTVDLPFWENRALQQSVAKLNPRLRVVKLASPQQAASEGFEGVVTIPRGGSVLDGFKTKWWQDAADWVVEEVALHNGPSGKPAGVVWFRSLESGRRFKLGPGQLGPEVFVRSIMDEPDYYTGVVMKVRSRHGHEGRAAKVLEVHQDKGVAPL